MVAHDRSELSTIKRRMEGVFLLFLLLIAILAVRLVVIQWVSAPDFGRIAERMQGRVMEIDARRGSIQDRNGSPLAIDTLAKSIAINPRVVKDPQATAARLASLLGLSEKDRDAMAERIARGKEHRKAYLKLQRGVKRALAEKILAISNGTHKKGAKPDPLLKTLFLEDSPVRVNPSGSDGIQLVGTVNIDGHGIEGLEMRYDSVLSGRNGERRARVDAAGRPVPDASDRIKPPVDGKNIRLTIDRDIQHFVEAELLKVAQAQSPDAATAIVMDVKTGEVLGMANYPMPRGNSKKIDPKERRNRAVTDLFEPGSIFKVITAAAALESGVNTTCHCTGTRAIGNRRVGCAHGASHGLVDLRKMVEKSCNLAAGALAERVGPKRMYQKLVDFGFNDKTGIEFPGEEHGRMLPPEKWRTMRTVNIGFGQGIVVTPIQILAAYAAVANDGVYNPPTLLKESGGTKVARRRPRRVMSASNAATLRSHMEAVVVSGTGRAAKVAGYSSAGKTGTAQIAGPHGYIPGAYVASFCGFTPASKPRLAILVSVWHPRRGQYGGTVAAPVFREISRRCLDYLAIPPDTPNDLKDGAGPQAAGGGHD